MGKLSSTVLDFFLSPEEESVIEKAASENEVANNVPGIAEDINPLRLRDKLFSEFGDEWIEWSPETVVLDILKGVANDLLMDKIAAMQLCLKTDTPWTEWHIFENVGRAFTSQEVDFHTFQPLSPGECSVTMRVMHSLRSDEKFSEEVNLYVANIIFSGNIVYAPSDLFPLQVDKELNNMIYFPSLKSSTEESWGKLKNINIFDKKFNLDDPTQNQLAKLAILKQYCKEYYEQ